MVAITTHIGDHPGAQRVDHRAPHPVQAAGHLVAAGTELAAGVQDRQHQRQRRDTFGRVDGHRDTAAVVDDPAAAAVDQFDLDVVAVAGQRLVHRVVDDLVHQVVQPALTGEPMYMPGRLRTASSPSRYLDLRRPVLALGVQVGSRVLEVDVLIRLASAFGGVVHRIIGSVRLARPHCQITHRQQLLRRSEPPGRRWACPMGREPTRPKCKILPLWGPTAQPLPPRWTRNAASPPISADSTRREASKLVPTGTCPPRSDGQPPRGRTVPTDHPDPQTNPTAWTSRPTDHPDPQTNPAAG